MKIRFLRNSPTFLLFLATLLALTSRGNAATINWTNAASGGWNTAANWNPNSVPGATDTAIITNAGVAVSLNSATTVGAIILGTNGAGTVILSLAGQTLALNGPLTVNPSGSFTVDSGVLAGNTNAVLRGTIGWTAGTLAGTLTLAANCTLNIAGGAGVNDLPNCVLTNNGTVAWASGKVRGGQSGTFIYNYGLWNAQSDQNLNYTDYGGNGVVFNNYGTFLKTGGTNTSQTLIENGVAFNQLAGAIDVQNGTNGLNLTLQGGGNFTGGYITTNTMGVTYLNVGSFTLNGTVTGTNTWQDAGNLVGANVVNGGLTWVGGVWNGAASVTIAPNTTLILAGGGGNGYNDFASTTVTNYGTVVWASGILRGGGGGTSIYNYGLWNAQSDQRWNYSDSGGNGVVFNNYGTFRKSGGTNTSQTLFQSGVVFNQLAGVIDVQNGTNGLNLTLQGGGKFTGGYITTNTTGVTYLNAGGFTLNGTVTGTNTLEYAGNLVGTNVINGALNWVGGVWNGAASVTVSSNTTLILAGGGGNGYNDFASTTMTNYGTVVWASGTLRGGGGGTFIYNYGLWNAQSDQRWNYSDSGGNGVVFNNYGTFRKSGGASEFANATVFQNGVVFNQLAGVIDVQNGTNGLEVAFQGGGNFTGGYITTNQFGLTVLSVGNFTLNGTVTGTNTWQDAGNLVGTNVINGALTWVGGVWNGAASVTISSNSTLIAASGAGVNDLGNTVVTNYGIFSWLSGDLQGGGVPGTFLYNYGLWDAQSDNLFQNGDGGNGTVFNNYGTLRKSRGASEFANATLFASGVVFNQLAGAIDVQNGTNGLELAFQGGGNLTGGYITTNQFGLTVLSAGNFTVNGTVTGTNTWQDAGNLVGANVINGGLTWVGGVWNGAASVTIAPNTTLILAGGGGNGYNDFASTTVTNYGTVTWASGTLRGGSSGTFIYNYGLWNAQSDQRLNYSDSGGNGVVFNNYGTFRKSAGTNTSQTLFQSGVFFKQLAGVIDVQNGSNGLNLTLQGGGNFTGGYITTNTTGVTYLNAGSFTLNGTVTGTNTLEYAGNLVGTNVINGALTWVGGVWNGAASVTVSSNTTLILAGGGGNGYNDFASTTITNYGTVVWASGTLRGGSSGTFIYNYGLWNAQSDQRLNYSDSGGNGVVFNNYGTFVKSGGTNTSATHIQSGVFFNNPGRLDSQVGVISLEGGYNLTNGILNFGINSLTDYGLIGLSGAAATGTVSANLNNGYQPIQGDSFTNLYYGSFSGIFTNATLPFADAWSTNYYPTFFVLTVLNARPTIASLTNQVVNELATLTVTNTATDLDIPAQSLTFSLASAPNGMTIAPLSTNAGVITWTPQQTNSPSTNAVSVVVTDNGSPSLSATNSFLVIVREVNVAPTLSNISTQTVNALALLTVTNAATNFNIHATNSGYGLVNPPSGASISASGVITWTPPRPQGPGTNTITTVVTNTDVYDLINPHLTATNTFTVIVYAPTLAQPTNYTVNAGQTVSFTASATDNDPTRTLTFSIVSGPAGATIGSSSGLFNWRAAAANAGLSNNVQLRVSDNSVPAVTDTKSFYIIENPSAPLTLKAIAKTATNFQVQVTGPIGPDYILQANGVLSNSSGWTNRLTNTPAASPFNLTDTNVIGFSNLFYRMQLAP